MGALFSKPKMPTIPQAVPPPAPKQEDESTNNVLSFLRLRKRSAFGRDQTFMADSGSGATGKDLLGQ